MSGLPWPRKLFLKVHGCPQKESWQPKQTITRFSPLHQVSPLLKIFNLLLGRNSIPPPSVKALTNGIRHILPDEITSTAFKLSSLPDPSACHTHSCFCLLSGDYSWSLPVPRTTRLHNSRAPFTMCTQQHGTLPLCCFKSCQSQRLTLRFISLRKFQE